MRVVFIIMFGLFVVVLGAQQEVEINSDGIVLPRTDTGGEVEGAIRYNSTTKEFQGYDGTSWIRLNNESKNRRLILSGKDFVSSNDSDLYHISSYSYKISQTSAIFHAFQIPVGARVTGVRAALYDQEATKELRLILERETNELNSTAGILIADFNTTGNTTSYQDLSDTTIAIHDGANIAKENDVYFVRVGAVETSDIFQSTSWTSAKLRLAQVTIDYIVE